ncbi:hypothetical protein HY68_08015, partial [Streptomyces sp. AcH 505]
MADAKVIPFGDDPRSRRGAAGRQKQAKDAATKRSQGRTRKPGGLIPVPEEEPLQQPAADERP